MDYKRKMKKLMGVKTQRKLSYIYHAFIRNDSMATAIKTLHNNRKFYNTHCGERCFILGNGPSLKEVSLEWLQDEQVFTVNYFNKVSGYKSAKTNYHIWIDPIFYNMHDHLQTDMKEVMECYDLIGKEGCECFLPICAYEFLEREGLLEQLKTNFIYMDGKLEEEANIKTDISNIITPYCTVVQYAIAIAVYMGFSKIYLLGCDSTWLLGVFNNLLKIENHDIHAYNNDRAEKEIEELLGYRSMSKILLDQYVWFLGYEKLYEHCKKKDVALFNCSAKTVVTSIPRLDLKKVLFGE